MLTTDSVRHTQLIHTMINIIIWKLDSQFYLTKYTFLISMSDNQKLRAIAEIIFGNNLPNNVSTVAAPKSYKGPHVNHL